ncbi:FAST kinase domain-containing protein 5, mitochondrial isoform X2 [Hyalella azteca]|uniref:FAST kinase domain-containing protein 5, mitochondrial isoform X2 n=1 Tax=Hyalella azteca TaxID=294128 RepID=A0A8B7NPJ5_HYAAZ|nr:FAST kinase domain-containing protein 5, mitochondrial isoform X2 [Hyalella azteca]
MYQHIRLWPSVAPVIRGVIGGRSELIHSVKNYGQSHISQTKEPWNIVCSAQQTHAQTSAFSTLPQNFHTQFTNSLSLQSKLYHSPILNSCNNLQDFIQNENEHAHSVMLSLPAYNNSTVRAANICDVLPPLDTSTSPPPLPHIDWSSVLPEGIAGSFIALSKQCKDRPMDLNSASHNNLNSALVSCVPSLSDATLKDVLAALTLWPPMPYIKDSNFHVLWEALDSECVKRVHKWDLQHAFVIADLWFILKLSRAGTYTKAMLPIVGHHFRSMESHQLVQYLFYMNLSRDKPSISFSLLEQNLSRVINQLSLEELGVVAMGLFKVQAFVKTPELTDALFDYLLSSDLRGASSITIGSIFKILRRTYQAMRVDKVMKLLEHVRPVLSQFSIQAQLQIALLGNDVLVFHPQVINEIALNFVNNSNKLRLKDIERIVFALALYNYIPPQKKDILDLFAEEIRRPERRQEINQYPKSFLSCVSYMACMGFFPNDLISTALQPDFITCVSSNSDNYLDIGREIMELDYTVEIDSPANYKGHRLDRSFRDNLLKTYNSRWRLPAEALAIKDPQPPVTHNERFIVDVHDKLGLLLGGDDRVITSFILPHVSIPDIVLCLNASGEPVPLPESFVSLPQVA